MGKALESRLWRVLPLGSGLGSRSLQIQLCRDKEKWCPYGDINDPRFKGSTGGSSALRADFNHIHHGTALETAAEAGWGRMGLGMDRGNGTSWVCLELGREMSGLLRLWVQDCPVMESGGAREGHPLSCLVGILLRDGGGGGELSDSEGPNHDP